MSGHDETQHRRLEIDYYGPAVAPEVFRAIVAMIEATTGAVDGIPQGSSPMTVASAGRLGAEVSWANTPDRTARTAPGRAKFNERFKTAEERSAHFADMARKSVEARRAKKIASR